MKKLHLLGLVLGLGLQIHAQQPDKKLVAKNESLIGIWSLVAVENVNPDGSKTLPYGSNPNGLLVFDTSGNYAIQILKAVRPKVAAGDKNKATPEENAALVQGNNSHFGHYSVDETKQIITFQVEHAFYPNWERTVQERFYTLANNELKYIVTNTTNGGAITAAVIWRRK